jgi:hypothetical protein
MTALHLLSNVPLRAKAAASLRWSGYLITACLVWLCATAGPPAVAQEPSSLQADSSDGGTTSWRRARRRELLSHERVAQTPANPELEYQYDPNFQYDAARESGENYDYAVDADSPPQYDGGPEGPYVGEGPDEFGYDDEGPCCDVPQTGYGCSAFSCHGFYARADYLAWWGKGFWAPPLVTTSVLGTPLAQAGILGLSTTSVLFPQGNFADTIQSGGRLRLGYWIDPCDTAAIEGTYFALAKSTTHFNASGADFPILARPFVNVETGSVGNDAQVLAYPILFDGQVSVSGNSQLQGAEAIFRHALCRGCDWRVDYLIGWRYNRLDDTLVVSDSREVLSTQTQQPVGTTLTEWDRFSTRNTFNGLQLGVITEVRRCRFWFETRTTIALGNNQSVVTIDGQQTTVIPGQQAVVTPAGLLAQSTNIGTYTDNNFTVVPQLGVNLGWEIGCGLWATVGYNFMYWCNVARPGDQIDTDVNLSQLDGELVGLARPAFTGIHADYWAQGLNFGLAYRY